MNILTLQLEYSHNFLKHRNYILEMQEHRRRLAVTWWVVSVFSKFTFQFLLFFYETFLLRAITFHTWVKWFEMVQNSWALQQSLTLATQRSTLKKNPAARIFAPAANRKQYWTSVGQQSQPTKTSDLQRKHEIGRIPNKNVSKAIISVQQSNQGLCWLVVHKSNPRWHL